MFQSLVFITSQDTPQNRLADFQDSGIYTFQANSTDTSIIQTETSIGIEQVREIKHFLSTKPLVEKHKVVIILQAELLTIEAQNALLKSLEEPGASVKIILITPHTHSLLPTILSRCQIIKSQKKQVTEDFSHIVDVIQDLKSRTIGDKISLSDTYKDRGEALEFTNDLIKFLRHNLLTSPTKQNLYNLTLTLYTNKIIKQNANIKLALDNLFIYLKM